MQRWVSGFFLVSGVLIGLMLPTQVTQGPTGERGEVGATGPRGTPGMNGLNGRDGRDGENGMRGMRGPQGRPGSQGLAGPAGPPGEIGAQGPAGATGANGPAGGFGAYGSFYDTTLSTPLTLAQAVRVPLNTTAFASGVSIVGGTKITFAVAGKFNIQFSTQLQKADTGDDWISVWLRENNENMTWTNTDVLITGRNETSRHVVAWNFFIEAQIGDFFELMMSSTTSTQMSIVSVGTQTSPDRPEIPGTILTVNQVG